MSERSCPCGHIRMVITPEGLDYYVEEERSVGLILGPMTPSEAPGRVVAEAHCEGCQGNLLVLRCAEGNCYFGEN